ncbi:MAG: arylmalonate decarboxylase [Xanthobacteraceae bacterium]|nr:MAG: arylmalonate decarboxylase [Xanthobacteraceae bacterium]
MALGFGWKARIGHLYPSGGLCDYEPQAMAPDGVQFVTTRMSFQSTSLEDYAAFTQDIEAHARLLADAEVQLIAFNCTAVSLVIGPDAINQRIKDATGIASTTTIEAVLAALAAARLRRFALLTPYPPEVVAAETAFFQARGHEVVAAAGLPCGTPVAQGTIPPSRWRELAHGLSSTDCDGLLISCAGIQLADTLATIEHDFRRPVIASNQALVWHCLRLLGISDRSTHYGALLQGQFDTPLPSLT